MSGFWPIRVAISILLLLTAAAGAFAHHGWGGYDSAQPLHLSGVIRASSYEHPHAMLKLAVDDRTWDVVLAPPSRLQVRGVTQAMLAPGTRVAVVGYPHRTIANEMRAERITINGKTTELR